MAFPHTVVLIDHQQASIQRFDAETVEAAHVRSRHHETRQHGSGVRSQHEFFAEVCDALARDAAILVTGGHTAQADFRHYVDKHRPALAPHIAGWQTVDHPSDGQLLAQARKFFAGFDRMQGKPG